MQNILDVGQAWIFFKTLIETPPRLVDVHETSTLNKIKIKAANGLGRLTWEKKNRVKRRLPTPCTQHLDHHLSEELV